MSERKKKLKYYFDLLMSKGSGSMIIMMFLFTGLFVLVLGFVSWLITRKEGASFGFSLWNTLMHTLDPGVIAGDEGSHGFLFVMLLATIVGLLFMALLIGFVNESITSKMADLAKGIEAVAENGHTVILGFNESTFIILSELIIANENQRGHRNTVVIMDDMEKQEMEERIRVRFPSTGNVTVVCRSGSIFSLNDLERCSIQTCKSVIITQEKDFDTIKTILAGTQLLNKEGTASKAYITAVINEQINERAARIAGQDTESIDEIKRSRDRLELLTTEEIISRIVTHTCRQTGLSNVFVELFDFSGHEFYISDENGRDAKLFEVMRGKTIREINRSLPYVTAIGTIDRHGKVNIGDPNTVTLNESDKLLVFEEDDDPIVFGTEENISYLPPRETYRNEPVHVLITECNGKLPMILEEMKYYLGEGSVIYIAADSKELLEMVKDNDIQELSEAGIDVIVRDSFDIYNCDRLALLLEEAKPNYVVMLSSTDPDENKADEKSLRLLLYVQEYKRNHPEAQIGVTCEMRSVENQTLAQRTVASDFIISRNIAALMMAQISENRELKDVFDLLLDSEGFEVYMKPVKYYLTPSEEMNYASVCEAVADKHEIPLGYMNNGLFVSNPPKSTKVTFSLDDELIVLAEDQIVC